MQHVWPQLEYAGILGFSFLAGIIKVARQERDENMRWGGYYLNILVYICIFYILGAGGFWTPLLQYLGSWQ